MNDNMKHLVEQAGLAQIYNGTQHPNMTGRFIPNLSGPSEEQLKKFAELVAATCVEIVEAQKISWSNTQVPPEVVIDMTVKNIKAYFGIEK